MNLYSSSSSPSGARARSSVFGMFRPDVTFPPAMIQSDTMFPAARRVLRAAARACWTALWCTGWCIWASGSWWAAARGGGTPEEDTRGADAAPPPDCACAASRARWPSSSSSRSSSLWASAARLCGRTLARTRCPLRSSPSARLNASMSGEKVRKRQTSPLL